MEGKKELEAEREAGIDKYGEASLMTEWSPSLDSHGNNIRLF